MMSDMNNGTISESLEKMLQDGAAFLRETIENKSSTVILSHRDADGLMATKEVSYYLSNEGQMQFVHKSNTALNKGEFTVLQPTKDKDIPIEIFESIAANDPSNLISLDLRLSGPCPTKIKVLRNREYSNKREKQKDKFRLLSVDHHEKELLIRTKDANGQTEILPYSGNESLQGIIFDPAAERLKPFVEVYNSGYSTPASYLCYKIIKRIDKEIATKLLPWVAIGIIGDHAHKGQNSTIKNIEIVKKAGEICGPELLEHVADVLQLVGYSKKEKWQVGVDAVIHADTPEDIVSEKTEYSKKEMDLFRPLKAEATYHIEQFINLYKDDKDINFYPYQLPPSSEVAVYVANCLSDQFPNRDIMISQIVKDEAVMHIRSGNCNINMFDIFKYVKQGDVGNGITTSGNGPVARIAFPTADYSKNFEKVNTYFVRVKKQ